MGLLHAEQCKCRCHKPTENAWRGDLEKIAWKHYDPESSINVEEMLDEMVPVITSLLATARRESYDAGVDTAIEQVEETLRSIETETLRVKKSEIAGLHIEMEVLSGVLDALRSLKKGREL